MISVCIPVYNFDIEPLVTALVPQAEAINGEIVIIDDGSTHYKEQNKEVAKKHNVIKYIELEQNIGRAAIRNLFTGYASFGYMLFLDCDSIIISDDFLEKYLETVRGYNPDVVCGGRIYGPRPDDRKKLLRWKYGITRESKPASERKKNPNASFMTNNFLVRKEILQKIRFNKKLRGYGHEDTLFGYELKKNGIEIIHIENPILNGDVEDVSVFLDKTRQGIANLAKIYKLYKNEEQLWEDITLLKSYVKIKKSGLLPFITFLSFVTLPVLRFMLLSIPSVKLFNMYKFLLLANELKR